MWVRSRPPSCPQDPHIRAGAAAAESLPVVLGEKLWRERKGGCGNSHWEALGTRGSLPLLLAFLENCKFPGKETLGLRAGVGGGGTDEICGFCLGTGSSGVWLMRNPRASASVSQGVVKLKTDSGVVISTLTAPGVFLVPEALV